jgi:hypothetical protein
MVLFDRIRDFFASLEERTFYYYISAFLGIIILFSAGLIYYKYDSTADLINDLESINEERETVVKPLLSKAARIKNKQKEINAMLSKDKAFKIGGAFKDICDKIHLTPSRTQPPTQSDFVDDKYQESVLVTEFTNISMKELLDILKAIEEVERIYTKQLDINKSKNDSTIDIKLTIATLLPKTIEAN